MCAVLWAHMLAYLRIGPRGFEDMHGPSYVQKISPSGHPNSIIYGRQVQSIRMGIQSIQWSSPFGSLGGLCFGPL